MYPQPGFHAFYEAYGLQFSGFFTMPDSSSQAAPSAISQTSTPASPAARHPVTAWIQTGVGATGDFLAVGLFFYSIPILLPYFSREIFGGSYGFAAMVQSVMLVFGALISPAVGALIDRIGVKTVMACGALLFGMGFFAMGNADSPAVLLLSVAIPIAIGATMIGGIAPAKLVTDWFANSPNKSLALGVAGVGVSLGGVVFPYVITFLIEGSSWRDALQVYGVICLIAIPFFYLIAHQPGDKVDQIAIAEAAPAPQPAQNWNFRSLSRTGGYMRIVLVFAFQFTVVTALFTHAAEVITSNLGEGSKLIVPTILALTAATAVAGKLAAGYAAKRWTNTGLVIAGFCMLQVFGVLLIVAAAFVGTPLYFLGFGIWGLGYGSGVPLLSFALSQAVPAAAFGRALGYSRPVLVPFQLLAPPALGFLYDATGSYNIGVASLALLALAGALLATTLRFPDNPEKAGPN